ncbi:unnamed protein product, partial [Staurois parvus]
LSLKACTHLCNQSPGLSQNWSQDWRFHPSQISLKSPGSRSQNRPYKHRRKVKKPLSIHIKHLPWSPSTCLVENPGLQIATHCHTLQ